ncbi:Oidioi.mRNA.OKI2018_I69.PAR.g9663.t1.cds [Oikopleura dioica]|uniref:Oidioi.mRNA.OKI2018_I69.PAR.g9663.t1.cds n=1 Tax=Oikopleura dioica TaxID=34765 RepID=A0ABN7RLP8_OIKDI|nr:Oidioi.mRNA.OKI2018_I69.PAR.g9663.t1.cds [Oikopleura dioica]
MASKKYFEDVAPTKCFLRRIGESTVPSQSSFSISSRYQQIQRTFPADRFESRTPLRDNLLCCYDRPLPLTVIQSREDQQECSIRMGKNVTKEILIIGSLLVLILIILAIILGVWRFLKRRKSKDIVTKTEINSNLWPTGIVVKPDIDWKSNSFSTVSCSKYEQSTKSSKSGNESRNPMLSKHHKKSTMSSKDDSLCFTDV